MKELRVGFHRSTGIAYPLYNTAIVKLAIKSLGIVKSTLLGLTWALRPPRSYLQNGGIFFAKLGKIVANFEVILAKSVIFVAK